MSLLWNRNRRGARACLFLGAGEVQLLAVRPGQPELLRSVELGEPTVECLLDSVDELLALFQDSSHISVEYVLGLAWCRQLLVPTGLQPEEEHIVRMQAQVLFQRRYGEPSEGWLLHLAASGMAKPRIASFMPEALMTALKDGTPRHVGRLRRVRPLLAVVWNQLHSVLVRKDGTLCCVDGDRLLVVAHDRSDPCSLEVRPFNQVARLPTDLGTVLDIVAPGIPMLFGRPAVKLSERSSPFDYVLCGIS